MLHAVPNGGVAVAQATLQVSSRGAGDNGIGLLRLAAFEYASALENEATGLAVDSSNDPLETDEGRRAVAAIHHQVLDLPLPFDIASVGLGDAGPTESWLVLALTIGRFIPLLDGEPSIRDLLHVLLPCDWEGSGGRKTGAGFALANARVQPWRAMIAG